MDSSAISRSMGTATKVTVQHHLRFVFEAGPGRHLGGAVIDGDGIVVLVFIIGDGLLLARLTLSLLFGEL